MSIATPSSLTEQIARLAHDTSERELYVPVDNTAVFTLLVKEMGKIAADYGGEDLILAVDGRTASEIGALDACREAAHEVIVLGELPMRWGDKPERTTAYPLLYEITARDHFFLAISSTINIAIVVRDDAEPDEDEAYYQGGWSSHRALVRGIAERLLPEDRAGAIAQLAEPADCDVGTRCDLRMASALSRHFASRERDIVMAKSDLSSVLDILKAISVRRRAHDILYVFVEQIALTIGLDRCSVVRIWGDEREGHVLASHDDESIRDVVIDLSKYPEIDRSIETRSKVVINDVSEDPLTKDCAEGLQKAGITALLVIPIILFDENVGSFFLRAARKGGHFVYREISFCEIVAETAANALERAYLLDSIQKVNRRLEHLAVTDGLTGLYNHRYFRDRLEEEFDRAVRYRLPLACMLIDVDNFKSVNDTYGHLVGDAVLRDMAAQTLKSVRKNDIVARYGGEELVAILPQTTLEGAIKQALRLREDIATARYEGLPSDMSITISIGVGMMAHDTMPDCEALIREADIALYEAKEAGRNCVVAEGVKQG